MYPLALAGRQPRSPDRCVGETVGAPLLFLFWKFVLVLRPLWCTRGLCRSASRGSITLPVTVPHEHRKILRMPSKLVQYLKCTRPKTNQIIRSKMHIMVSRRFTFRRRAASTTSRATSSLVPALPVSNMVSLIAIYMYFAPKLLQVLGAKHES